MSDRSDDVQSASVPPQLRVDYASGLLDEADAACRTRSCSSRVGLTMRARANVAEPNAMTLATVGADGSPSARIVLLKDFDERGFTFHTNYNSRKGRELAENPVRRCAFSGSRWSGRCGSRDGRSG